MGRIEGMTAILVGAGSVGPGWSNGRATAVLLAREGARLFAVDRDTDSLAETCRLIRDEGHEVDAHVADVTEASQVEELVSLCLARHGRIDILVNNVGGSCLGGPVELTEEEWDGQFETNLRYVFLACKHVLPVMEKQEAGAIVNIASIAALRDYGPFVPAYAASKAALIQFTRRLGTRYAARGIRCNTVVPGLMDTPLVAKRLAGQQGEADLQAFKAARDRKVPLGHMGTAWDVAHAVLFLASNESRYVTATELVVDGGLSASCVVPAPP